MGGKSGTRRGRVLSAGCQHSGKMCERHNVRKRIRRRGEKKSNGGDLLPEVARQYRGVDWK